MAQDQYSAVWVSFSSISDFLNCPRAYYLKNVYRDSQTGNKIKLVSPPLALGQVVHTVIESLSVLPQEKRFNQSLIEKFEQSWQNVEGPKGGFTNPEIENQYKARGRKMMSRLAQDPGPLQNLAVKIQMDLPHFWFSEKDNLILCGKIDWLEYLPREDAVHIIDFKTGLEEDEKDSLQLAIYHLLVSECQDRTVAKASYWYLEHNQIPREVPLPNLVESRQKILTIAKKIKLTRQLQRFNCPHPKGCFACRPYEAILNGKAKRVGTSGYGQDLYILNQIQDSEGQREKSIIH